jgi:hypothetical protein
MAGIDAFAPRKAFGLGVLLPGVSPKNLLLTAGAAAGLAQLGPSTTDAVVALIVSTRTASLTGTPPPPRPHRPPPPHGPKHRKRPPSGV